MLRQRTPTRDPDDTGTDFTSCESDEEKVQQEKRLPQRTSVAYLSGHYVLYKKSANKYNTRDSALTLARPPSDSASLSGNSAGRERVRPPDSAALSGF